MSILSPRQQHPLLPQPWLLCVLVCYHAHPTDLLPDLLPDHHFETQLRSYSLRAKPAILERSHLRASDCHHDHAPGPHVVHHPEGHKEPKGDQCDPRERDAVERGFLEVHAVHQRLNARGSHIGCPLLFLHRDPEEDEPEIPGVTAVDHCLHFLRLLLFRVSALDSLRVPGE